MRLPKLNYRGFLLRLIVCLLILGGLYLAVFGRPHFTSQPKQPSGNSAKLAEIRAAADEGYVAAQELSGFNNSGVTADAQLNSLYAHYKESTGRLNRALAAAPPALTLPDRTKLKAVIARQRAAGQIFEKHYKPLAQVIQYEPAADLPQLNAGTDKIVAARAAAAKKGLLKAADNPSVNAEIAQNLRLEADCFDKLSGGLASKQLSDLTISRQQCVSAYPALRLKAIQSATQAAWGGDYAAYAKNTVRPLIKSLDALIKAQS